ncbi:MAG: FIST N-terminal domain-containing protein [Geobacteraceae bacterium]|nr:FIST N-terminal domain-containing protein [Geobacteraceae bacterium]
MYIKTAYSTKGTSDEVIQDIKSQLGDFDTKMLVFFASVRLAPNIISQKIQDAFPDSTVFGCSTSGEIVSGKMLKNSLVAMAFNATAVNDVKVEVVENPKNENSVKKAFATFESYFKTPMFELDPSKYVGLTFIDGLSGAEEKLIDKIGDLTNVNFMGGSAGDDLKFEATYVYANGKAYTNAAVLAVLKPGVPFTFIKTQSFCDLGKTLTVTKANEEKREVIEFNDKPAAEAYAELLGVAVEEATNRFMHNPVGLVIDGMPFVRSPQRIKGTNMIFYCGVTEGMELSLLESTDIIADTGAAIKQAKDELGSISGIININCILRTLELDQKQLTDEYGKLFSEYPTVGFSSYGEQFIGHINQTATMLVFK